MSFTRTALPRNTTNAKLAHLGSVVIVLLSTTAAPVMAQVCSLDPVVTNAKQLGVTVADSAIGAQTCSIVEDEAVSTSSTTDATADKPAAPSAEAAQKLAAEVRSAWDRVSKFVAQLWARFERGLSTLTGF